MISYSLSLVRGSNPRVFSKWALLLFLYTRVKKKWTEKISW